jgi:hypothetical protein
MFTLCYIPSIISAIYTIASYSTIKKASYSSSRPYNGNLNMPYLMTLVLILAYLISLSTTNVAATALPPRAIFQPNPATASSSSSRPSHTLTKRHNWVLTCYSGPAGLEDIKLSKRCINARYYCDGSKMKPNSFPIPHTPT